jgi:MFS transporter, FHS family, glucose/mannose:H+ symporter
MRYGDNGLIRNRLLITAANFIAVGCMGMSMGFLGPSLPSLRESLRLDLESAGLFTSGIQFGYGLMGTVGGILSDLFRGERVLAAGCLFLGGSTLLFGLWDSYALNLILVTLTGIGCGLILGSSHAVLVGLHPQRKGSILNFHHIFAAAGSLIAPLFIGYLLSRQGRWQYGYEGLGLFVLTLAVFLTFVRAPKGEVKNRVRFNLIGRLTRQKNFIFMVLVDFLSMGTQFSVIYLSVTFLKEAKGFSVVTASAVLSAFFIFMILGRLLCGWLMTRVANTRIILILLLCLILISVIGWRGQGWVSAVGIMMTGLAISGIFPSLVALTGEIYHDMAGTAMGFMVMMSGFGGMFFCWLTAVFSQKTDVGFGFIVPIVSAVIALALFSVQYGSLLQGELERRARVKG